MGTVSIEELKKLIGSNPEVVNFGTSENAVNPLWFDKAEKVLGVKLTDSYLWFLKNYAAGEIGGDEVYSIYGMEFDNINGGDIVFQHMVNQKNGLYESNSIVISETDLGETFYFDYSQFDGSECPIYLRLPSNKRELYAHDFYEFLYKRIKERIF